MNNMYDILAKMALLEGKNNKPDFLDLDQDGDRSEPMKKAAQEKDEDVSEGSTGDYSAKKARAGKDIGQPGKNFEKIAKSAAERYGSKERGEKVAGAVLAKLRAKESVEESEVEEGNEFSGAREEAIRAGRPTFTVGGKTYRVTGDKDVKEGRTEYDPIAGVTRHRGSYGTEYQGDDGDEDDYDQWGNRKPGAKKKASVDPTAPKRGRGRPKGTGRAIGAKGPTGRSKLMREESDIESELEDIVRQYEKLEGPGSWNQSPRPHEFSDDHSAWKRGSDLVKKYHDLKKNSLEETDSAGQPHPSAQLGHPERAAHRRQLARDHDKLNDLEQRALEKAKRTQLPAKKLKEATGNLSSIVRANQRDVDAFMRDGELSDSLYDALYGYYTDEMPYGTAKARSGDPYEWISDRFYDDMGGGKGIAEGQDPGEYDQEGDMAKSQARTIEDAAEELQSILDSEENLPEWVQKKISLAMDYIDTARDYLKANRPEQDPMVAEKAVSKAQRAAAGIARAAQKGDIPKSELRGASKEMAKMEPKELKKFAKTKEKGLPEKKKEESVEETTVAGSMAVSDAAPKGKKGMQFGKGVYESRLEEGFQASLDSVLNESMSMNVSTDDQGGKSLTITATDADAEKLSDILKLAGMQSSGYQTACSSCGGIHEGSCQMEEGLANSPDPVSAELGDTGDYGVAGGLNGPKQQVNPNNAGDNPLAMRDLGRTAHTLSLGKVDESVEQRLWDIYKRYES
jgi:hypothetical protein